MHVPLPVLTPFPPQPPAVGSVPTAGQTACFRGTRSLGAWNGRPRCAAAQPPHRPTQRTAPSVEYLPLSSSGAPPALGFPPASLAVSCCLRGILPLRGSPLSIRGLRGTGLDGSVFSGDHGLSPGPNRCPCTCGL